MMQLYNSEIIGTAGIVALGSGGIGAAPRVLLVEDEPLVALDLEQQLTRLGLDVACNVRTVVAALEWLERNECDVALLDVSLFSGTSAPVAVELARRGVPFAVCTGYSAGQLPPEFDGAPRIAKPIPSGTLRQVLHQLVQEHGGRSGATTAASRGS